MRYVRFRDADMSESCGNVAFWTHVGHGGLIIP
jgi:hypothetical protein